jgi:hypothetical protein
MLPGQNSFCKQAHGAVTHSEAALVGGDSGRELGQVEELGREEAHDTKHGNTAVLQLSFLFRHQT